MKNVEAADIAMARVRQAIHQALPRRANTPSPPIMAREVIVDRTTVSNAKSGAWNQSNQGNMRAIKAPGMKFGMNEKCSR